jgi:hypothetical protein
MKKQMIALRNITVIVKSPLVVSPIILVVTWWRPEGLERDKSRPNIWFLDICC